MSLETSSHFLLECPLYSSQGEVLRFRLSNFLPAEIPLTEGILLGSENSLIGTTLYPSVAKATMDCIWRTKRLK